jgi:hypothetical protein
VCCPQTTNGLALFKFEAHNAHSHHNHHNK